MRRSPSRRPGDALASREARTYRVRVRSTTAGPRGATRSRVEAGLLDAATGSARRSLCRTTPARAAVAVTAPAPEFDVRRRGPSARLYVTSLGVHRMTINGRRGVRRPAGPGLDAVRQAHRSPRPTTSPSCCGVGTNVIGGGPRRWLVPRTTGLGPSGTGCHYGPEVGLLAQLELDAGGRRRRRRSRRTGRGGRRPARSASADLYDGAGSTSASAAPDGTGPGSTHAAWSPAAVVPIDRHVDRAADRPRPVRRSSDATAYRAAGPDGGGWRLDAGQNIAGCVRTARSRDRRDDGHRASCGGPRARWRAAHALASIGQGDRHATSSPATRSTELEPVVHLPRLPLRRGRRRRRAILDASVVAISSDRARRAAVRLLGPDC